ncbi:MAG: cyclic nucleotide-binding domain-containing protein [Planctomycetia bacterium]|nr:cyclic nucleotide-binding domain-containing protein [Planctomycetia bacterium]
MSIICAGGEAINEVSLHVLRRSDLCRGLKAAEVQQIADAVRPIRAPAGQVICRQGDTGDTMYVLVRGRVKVAVERGGETYRLLDYLGRGEHFGEMAVLTDGLRTATVSAVVDTDLLELNREQFDRLLQVVPGFAANLSRSLGFRLRWETSRRQRRHEPVVIGLVNSTLRTQALVRPLARALVDHGDSIEVLTDRPDGWPSEGNYLVERIPETLSGDDKVRTVQERLQQVIEHHDRVLVDLTQAGLEGDLPRLLAPCEEIWWLVEPRFYATSCRNLRKLIAADPRLAGRVRLVWILTEGEPFAPPQPADLGIAGPDFKVVLGEPHQAASRHERQGVERLVRHLRGTQIGLALGGGGARGLAHLGALRALERAGISFDLMAGTSSGALTGLAYAGGWSPQEALDAFKEALTPPRWLRAMPGADRLYLWTMFRIGAWDGKLRYFFRDATLEQLQIPFTTVTVDLVTGKQVIRDRGDAIHAVLESINVPMVARPILRDGMALVDGGVLNNLPADIVVERGASFVVGIDVATKMPARYGRNVPGMATAKMRRAGPLETLLRVNEVQAYGITALRTGAVDLMITPDTSAFEFAEFSRAYELADVGEAAAEAMIPQLKQMLSELRGGPK